MTDRITWLENARPNYFANDLYKIRPNIYNHKTQSVQNVSFSTKITRAMKHGFHKRRLYNMSINYTELYWLSK